MAQATARRLAELLLADHANDPSFDVDFLDGPFTELIVGALESLDCEVERLAGTRLRVRRGAGRMKAESGGRKDEGGRMRDEG